MDKRKVSCLECRKKKTKCDGGTPCGRCLGKGITDCIYSKLKAPGRPFKNTVITKLSLSSNIEKSSFCKEFILETVNDKEIKKKQQQYQQESLTVTINQSFSKVFRHYHKSLSLNHKLRQQIANIPNRVYLRSLNHIFTSAACFVTSIVIRRLSNLRLSYYSETGFLTYALNRDRSYQFFETPSPNAIVSNPLLSLPPNEAMRLIDTFFELDPYSILLNKTSILEKYWSDTADPLIMSVIYGSALSKLPLKESEPIELWTEWDKKDRNPFLQYAYILLLSTNTQVTPNVYIATNLLAHFEGCFGYPKRALALFSVIITMGVRLRLTDKAYLATMDPLVRESLIMAFWVTHKASVTGFAELERSAAYLYGKVNVPLPPSSHAYSAIYHFDKLNNNIPSLQQRSYLIESFYMESIIAKLNHKILFCAKKKHLDNDRKAIDIANVFEEFVRETAELRSTWTEFQAFCIDSIVLYYKICLSFVREDCFNFFLQWCELPPKLDLTQLSSVYLVNKLLPLATELVDKIMNFFSRPEICYNNLANAPMALIVSQLDSASQIIMYAAVLQPQNLILRNYLELIVMVLTNDQYFDSWDAANEVREPISEFLEGFYTSQDESVFDFNWFQDDHLWDVSITPLCGLTGEVSTLFDGIV